MKAIKTLLLLACIVMSALSAQAQFSPQISLSSGLSYSNIAYKTTTNINNDFQEWLTGVPVQVQFNAYSKKGIRLGIAAGYWQKGFKTDVIVQNEMGEIVTKEVLDRYTYVNVGVNIGYTLPLNRKLLLVGSLIPSLNLEMDYTGDDRRMVVDLDRNRTIVALGGQLGVEYALHKKLSVIGNMNFQHDLTPLYTIDYRDENNEPSGSLSAYHLGYSALLGIAYTL